MERDGPLRVLAVDGGGIRGIYAAACLAHIEKHAGVRLIDHVDLLAGTSTGAIICLGLAAGLSAADIHEAYRSHGKAIFDNRWAGLTRWFHRGYSPAPLRDLLESLLGDKVMGDASKPLVVPAFNAATGFTTVFKTKHHDYLHYGEALRMVDVALASAAAPTYFPAVQIEGTEAYLDGGLWANNPSVVAIAEAVRYLGADLDSIALVSLGTGRRKRWDQHSRIKNRGKLGWASHLMPLQLDAVSVAADNQARFFLGEERYLRINEDLPVEMDLDDASNIDRLSELGKSAGMMNLRRVEAMLRFPQGCAGPT